MSLTVDVLHGPQPAVDLEQGFGVGPALHAGQPVPYPWPPHTYVELAALPTAVACARLHARNLLWEWGLDWLAPDTELLVAELIANAVRVTVARDEANVHLRLSSNGTRVLIEVWDGDPWPPTAADRDQDGTPEPQAERGRGLFLVAALSTRWDWYLTEEPRGKVVWCQLQALAPAPRSPEDHRTGRQAGSRPVSPMSRSSRGAESGTLTGGPNNPGLPSGFCVTAGSTNASAA
jgi:anti-sigma regulatory factor (Ser/Thr protein kinase)